VTLIIPTKCLYNVLQDYESGLFICLKTFAGFGIDHVERYHRKTGCSVFLHMLREKIEVCLLFLKFESFKHLHFFIN